MSEATKSDAATDRRPRDPDLAIQIGAAIRKKRRGLDLTQQQLADDLGISVEFVGRVERGHALPGLITFRDLVRRLGIDANLALTMEDGLDD